MTKEEYKKLKDKAYTLSESRYDKMTDGDWCHVSLSQMADDEDENIAKLSEYEQVKIYKATTRIRGYYKYYALVK